MKFHYHFCHSLIFLPRPHQTQKWETAEHELIFKFFKKGLQSCDILSKKLLFGAYNDYYIDHDKASIANDTLYNSCIKWLKENNLKLNGKFSADSLKKMIEAVEVSLPSKNCLQINN